MSRWIVGDRFVCLGRRGWQDLVTGACVHLEIRAWSHHPRLDPHTEQATASSPDAPRPYVSIDRGRVGVGGWFDAYEIGSSARSAAEATVKDVVSSVLREARHQDTAGIRTLFVPSHSRAPALALALPLRRLGFVVLRAGVRVSAGVRATLEHRHLAIVISTDREMVGAARWIEHLTRVSSRGHLVIDTRRPGPDSAHAARGARQPRRDANRRGS